MLVFLFNLTEVRPHIGRHVTNEYMNQRLIIITHYSLMVISVNEQLTFIT